MGGREQAAQPIGGQSDILQQLVEHRRVGAIAQRCADRLRPECANHEQKPTLVSDLVFFVPRPCLAVGDVGQSRGSFAAVKVIGGVGAQERTRTSTGVTR